MDAYIVSLLKAWWGDARDGRERLLLRLPAADRRRPLALPDVAARCSTARSRATSSRARTRPSASANWRAAPARAGEARLARRPRPGRDRDARRSGTTARRSRPASCATERDRDRGLLPAGGGARREGRHLHEHPAPAAVAPQGGRAAAATAARSSGSIYHLGRLLREKLAGSSEPRDRPLLEPDLGLPDRGRRSRSPTPRRCCARSTAGTTERRRRSRRLPELKADGSTACGCWIYCGCLRGRRQPGGAAKPRWEQELRSRPSGAGPGRRTGASSTTAPRPTPTGKPWSERKQLRLVGRRAGEVDRRRRARLRGGQAARLRAARRRARPRTRSRGDAPVHHAGRRARLAVRPAGARGRAAADALRAARVAVREPALRRSARTRARQQVRAPRTRTTRAAASRAAEVYPVRGHDLPADRAPHGRRDVALRCRTWPSCSRRCSARSARSSRASAASSTAAGRRSSTRAPAIEARVLVTDRMRAAEVEGRAVAPGRPALPLGLARPRRPATRPTTCSRSRSTRTSTSRRSKALTCDIRPGRRPRGPRAARGSSRRRARRRRGAREPARDRTATEAHEPRSGFFTDTRLHRLQGVRGRLQGVERRPRGRPATSPASRYDNTGGARREHLAPRRLHRAEPSPRRRRAASSTPSAALADELGRLQALHARRAASTSARPARSSAPSSAPSSCSRTSATAAATASPRARSA